MNFWKGKKTAFVGDSVRILSEDSELNGKVTDGVYSEPLRIRKVYKA